MKTNSHEAWVAAHDAYLKAIIVAIDIYNLAEGLSWKDSARAIAFRIGDAAREDGIVIDVMAEIMSSPAARAINSKDSDKRIDPASPASGTFKADEYPKKPANCTCGFPLMVVRNMCGHEESCPCYIEWAKKVFPPIPVPLAELRRRFDIANEQDATEALIKLRAVVGDIVSYLEDRERNQSV